MSINNKFGQDDDSLKSYKFTRTEVFNTAWRVQNSLKSFGPSRQGSFVDLLDYVVKNQEKVSDEDLAQWTIPVCDWDNVEVVNARCNDKWDCLHKVIVKSCQEMNYGETQAWPYEYVKIADP